MLVVGSSLHVYPAAGIPRLAHDSGAELLIVNAEPTPFDSSARVVLHGKAGEILPRIVSSIDGRR
jgi:NAD-dependent deacetylase